MTIIGIGCYFALVIINEIGDINRFPDSHHLCSYAGLIPSTHNSGGISYNGSITKTACLRIS
jgi:transposase